MYFLLRSKDGYIYLNSKNIITIILLHKMDIDDPRRPLLGDDVAMSRFRRSTLKLCGGESWKRRFPIITWLPKYSWECLFRDAIAGITVGLTSIPQGIAYAMVAGLPPQVGLYSSIFPGLIYMIFGSCKDVTIGPTAILAALLAKYVAQSAAFAYLATFLTGCVILTLGVLQLGFLLDFISKPVIIGFTTAAALQIGASQLKSLFRISGKSGGTFISAITNFFTYIPTIQLWDTVLGLASIIALFLIKRVKIPPMQTDSRYRSLVCHTLQYVLRARNALVVFGATLLAYLLYINGHKPFALTGTIEGGLPDFGPPPFSAVVNNKTLNFNEMLAVFGPEGFVMPLVAILESIAIAKAFASGKTVDATQEMIALGACNIISSFCQAMPSTGSFTRTALNHASGVMTQAGALFKASLVLLSVTLLDAAFYFIPKTSLAAVIIVAMMSIIEFKIITKLWRNSKVELLVYTVSVVTGACAGLEYGIAAGCACDAIRVLAAAARPTVHAHHYKVGHQDCTSITLQGSLSYSSAQYLASRVKKVMPSQSAVLVLDGRHLLAIDLGVAESLISVIVELERRHHVLMWNFTESIERLFSELHVGFESRFVSGPSIDQHVLGLNIHNDLRNNVLNTF